LLVILFLSLSISYPISSAFCFRSSCPPNYFITCRSRPRFLGQHSRQSPATFRLRVIIINMAAVAQSIIETASDAGNSRLAFRRCHVTQSCMFSVPYLFGCQETSDWAEFRTEQAVITGSKKCADACRSILNSGLL